MARTPSWRRALAAALIAGAAVGCEENVTAPGNCPEFCPSDSLQIVDTVLTGIVTSDTSIRGFTNVADLPIMLLSDSAAYRTRGVMRFAAIPERWFPIPGDTAGVRLGSIDSMVLELTVSHRDTNVLDQRIMVVTLPDTTDTTMTFASSDALFAAPVDSIIIPDSVETGRLRTLLPPLAVTPSTLDSMTPAYGIMIRAAAPTMTTVAATDFSGAPPRLKVYARGLAPRDTFTTTFEVTPAFDNYLQESPPPVPADTTITVGQQPASRAFLRFELPASIVDSTTIVRATLLLRAVRPVFERAGIRYQIEAAPILKDFGGKSIVFSDSAAFGNGFVTAGDTGLVSIEMVNVLRLWRGIDPDSLPRVVVLRNTNEGIFIGELEVLGASTADPPRLQVTYVRPLRFGVP